MSKTKRLIITNARDAEQSFRQVETWANTVDDAIELRALDANNVPLDAGSTIYLSVRLVNGANKIVVMKRFGDTFTEIGTINIV